MKGERVTKEPSTTPQVSIGNDWGKATLRDEEYQKHKYNSVNKDSLIKKKGAFIDRREIKKGKQLAKTLGVQNYGSILFTTVPLQKNNPSAVSSSTLLKESLFLQ